ncbi:M23 family metallopeptidase [Salinibacterium sp. G-O1]|uniref:M23 family metallopeptidase n=1 Tax=Salinibacterium sp. G-O1 TaxID=3046208 RepID=UPI0024B9EA3F|nr:M23 family metallopeptidase [Salinibacterium sp. G-O1]MDJ0333961.1 M23 family metallopeptidase [Salinibacterium sp. G-O1]
MTHRYPDAPAALTRRESLSREKRPRLKATRTLRSSARGGGGIALVALMMATYVLPAYAAQEDVAPAEASGPSAQLQTVRVPGVSANASDSILTSARDSFQVTKTVSAGVPYSRIADTFTNNPNAAIQWPFLVGVPISSWFGFRDCTGCPTFHKGIDLNPGLGTAIQAIADGVVTEVGPNDADYGTNVVITHQINGQVISSRYAHMIEGSTPLAVGDVVTVGALVGQVGNTGISTGAHLHFEILLDGVTPTDPYAWLKAEVGS